MSATTVKASSPSNETGYRDFELGSFKFSRDEYFVYIRWPAPATGKTITHVMSAENFQRAMMRDVAWGFFYGQVNFDDVFGTKNLYGQVQMYAGAYNPSFNGEGLDLTETFETPEIMATFKAILADWTNEGFDPFAAPQETGTAWLGQKNGSNLEAIERQRATCRRMPGVLGDVPLRSDDNGYPVNRAFHDVPQDEPEVFAEPGFEKDVSAFSLFKYLSRSDVTWNPSISSVCKESLFCPTTEEYILPIKHGNDRVEWFIQLSDEIIWEVDDKNTGAPRAKIIMKPGDVAAMPADIRHQGFSRKRSMLLVWENGNPELPEMYESGKLKPYPIEF
nr:hydroxyquinol 1,2-dioxygenase [uncultured Pseudomonas sp.]